ncbi:MAG: PTS sugar transporter subunit IIA [bacterium]
MKLMVKDVAALLNVSEKTIYRWVSKGEIPSYKLKDHYRFSRAEVLEWASAKRMPISEEALAPAEQDSGPLPTFVEAIESGGIFYRVAGADKTAALKSVVDMLRLPDDVDRGFLHKILMAREALGSTGIGDGIAIPHARNPIVLNVERPGITLCFLEHPIEFDAIDGKPVRVLFTIISPTVRSHLHLLSRLAFVMRDAGFKDAVMREASRDEILSQARRVESGLARGREGGA